MKISLFLKDRIPRYGIWAAGVVLTVIFLSAFRVPDQALCTAVVIPLLAGIIGEWWEISRKKAYYDKIASTIEQLDKKYLLAEMIMPFSSSMSCASFCVYSSKHTVCF